MIFLRGKVIAHIAKSGARLEAGRWASVQLNRIRRFLTTVLQRVQAEGDKFERPATQPRTPHILL